MKLKHTVVIAILGCAAAGWAGQANQTQSQNAPDAPRTRFGDPTSIARMYQDYVYGVVKRANKSELILDKTPFGDSQTFKLTQKTRFVHNAKPVKQEIFKPGEMVWIDMRRDKKTGDMIAKKVVTGVAPTGKP